MRQRSFTFGKSEITGITSCMWLILLIQGQDTPQTSQLVRASICTCYRTATHIHTHYFQQSKQKNKLAFKKNKPAVFRCLLDPWYEAVITTFLSQPNIETREEQMFAFLRRAIFQQMRSRTTNIDGARSLSLLELSWAPCPPPESPLPAQVWVTILAGLQTQMPHSEGQGAPQNAQTICSNTAEGGDGHGSAPGVTRSSSTCGLWSRSLSTCSVLNAQTFTEIQPML